MTNISARLKRIRYEQRLTQSGLGEIVGLSKQSIANIENGHNNPSTELVIKLIEKLNINANWFLAGEGEMYISQKPEDFSVKVREVLKSEGLIK